MTTSSPKLGKAAKLGTALFLGFLAFAPPGTMIAIGLVLLWVLRDYPLVSAIIALLIILGTLLFIIRRFRLFK